MLIPVLSSAWAYNLFREIRATAIGSSTMFCSLAMGVAAMIIVIKLIRLSYQIMSDEQQAGFGGVRLWQILRPIMILVLIQSCNIWIGGLDSLANGIALTVQASVDAASDKKQIVDVFKISTVEKDAISADELKAAEAEAEKETQEWIEKLEQNAEGGRFKDEISLALAEFSKERRTRQTLQEKVGDLAVKKGLTDDRDGTVIRKSVNRWLRVSNRHTTSTDTGYQIDIHDKNLIPAVCCWLYEKLYLVIQCFAEIILTVLALCAPWMLVSTLIEPWKTNFWNFVSQYVQVSFWKVTAACINFATVTFRKTAVAAILSGAVDDLNCAIATDSMRTGSTHADASIALSAIMSVAGVFALLKVAEITATIIPSSGGSIGSAAGGAGGALAPVKAGIGAAKMAAGAAVAAVGGIAAKGAQQKQAQQQ